MALGRINLTQEVSKIFKMNTQKQGRRFVDSGKSTANRRLSRRERKLALLQDVGFVLLQKAIWSRTVGNNGLPAIKSNFCDLLYSDLSKNNLNGNIPYQLPPSAQHVDLSDNGFNGEIPYSISQMENLKYLDLGHNHLNKLSDMFGKMHKLTYLDLSLNSFSGKLPQSFGSLSSLKRLYLQNNQFTGSIDVLSKLPLNDLDVENNRFTGAVPEKLQGIDGIRTGGNSFTSGGNLNRKSSKTDEDDDGKGSGGMSGIAIAGIVTGVLLALVCRLGT